jgi:hypothetical protein
MDRVVLGIAVQARRDGFINLDKKTQVLPKIGQEFSRALRVVWRCRIDEHFARRLAPPQMQSPQAVYPSVAVPGPLTPVQVIEMNAGLASFVAV